MRAWLVVLLLISVSGPAAASEATAVAGDTVKLGDTSYRLDGVVAPSPDQVCLDANAIAWACGIGARDRLAALISMATVGCHDNGPDPLYPERRVGLCWVEGDDLSLNQRLVREGWALSFEPYPRARLKADQDDAQDNRRGLWNGCFTTPSDLQRWNKAKAKLLGPSCRNVDSKTARDLLFPAHPAMPIGCTIKGIVALRARATGHRGIYHLETCRSYQRAPWPNRWFCDEGAARAEGYRKSFTC
jgi:endonuclease YncB( thermonuclease family)